MEIEGGYIVIFGIAVEFYCWGRSSVRFWVLSVWWDGSRIGKVSLCDLVGMQGEVG